MLPLAKMASESVSPYKTVGLSRGEDLYAYPSPLLQKHKEVWLEDISVLMNE